MSLCRSIKIVFGYRLLCGLLAAAPFSYADEILVFEQGVNGYEGNVIASVDVANPNDTDIGDPTFLWDGNSVLDNVFSDVDYLLMRFDNIFGTSTGLIAPERVIKSAHLRYSVSNGGDPARMYELLVPFVEGSWSDQPWIGTTTPALVPGVHYAAGNDIQAPGGPVNTNVSVDVTPSLLKWQTGEIENNGWVFIPTGIDDVAFLSNTRQEEHRPRLVVRTPNRVYTFEDGVDGYEGTIDTWTEIVIPLRDTGRDSRVLADGGLDDPSWAYMKFVDIIGTSEGQIPPNTQILDARIEISIFNAGDPVYVFDMNPGYDFNEYSVAEAAQLGVLPTNVATHGNPRTVPGTGQYTLPDLDFENDPEGSQKIVSVYYDPESFLDIPIPQADVPEEVFPWPLDPSNLPTFFDSTQVDVIPGGFLGNTSVNVTTSIQRYANGDENTGWFFFHEGSFGGPGDGTEWRSSEWSQPDIPKLTVRTANRTYVFQDGLDGYDGTVDTYIDELNPNTAYGNEPVLVTHGSGDNGGFRTVLIRFDGIIGNGPNQVPPNTAIENAVLSLVSNEQGGGSRLWEIQPGKRFDNDTTYSSFGNPLDLIGNALSAEPLQPNPDVGAGVILFMNVTTSVQKYSNGTENTGWAIIPLIPFYDEGPGTGVGGLGQADDVLTYNSSEVVKPEPPGRPRLTVVLEGGPTSIHDFSIYE